MDELIERNPTDPVYHIAPGNKSWDYHLSKVLGRHEPGRFKHTYQNIEQLQKEVKEFLAKHPQSKIRRRKINVVSIRNRRGFNRRVNRLSTVLTRVKAAYPHLLHFLLVFCRGFVGTGSAPEDEDVETGTEMSIENVLKGKPEFPKSQ